MRVDQVLNQDQIWTSERGVMPIDDMDVDHVQRLILWLEQRAPLLASTYFLLTLGSSVLDAPDDVVGDFVTETNRALDDPVTWLHNTTLVKRLDAIVDEALSGAEDAAP